MVIYRNVFDVMLHLEAEWPFKKYLNCRHNFVRTRTLAGFKVWGEQNTFLGGKDFSICHIFDRNFSEHSKILEVQKDLGAIVPESSPHLCLPAWAEPTPENPPFGGFLCVQGG